MSEVSEKDVEIENSDSTDEDAPLVLVSEVLPDSLPILAIRPRPLFPGIPVPL